MNELARRFRLEDVGHSAGVLDVEKLGWVNRHYVKHAAPDRLVELSLPHLQREGHVEVPTTDALSYLATVIPLVAPSVDRLDQIPARLGFLFEY